MNILPLKHLRSQTYLKRYKDALKILVTKIIDGEKQGQKPWEKDAIVCHSDLAMDMEYGHDIPLINPIPLCCSDSERKPCLK